MFASIATLMHKRRRLALLAALVLLVLAGAVGGSLQQKLTNGASDYDDPSGANVAARQTIQRATGIDPQQGYVLLVRSDEKLTADSAAPAAVAEAVKVLKARPEVKQVLDFADSKMPTLISTDGHSTAVVAELGPLPSPGDVDAVKALQAAVAADPLLAGTTLVGGATPGHVQVADVSTKDLGLGETIALPILLVLLFFVFRGLVAAFIPLVGGIFAMMLAMALTRVLTTVTSVSASAMDLIFALGLGLCIDFSLLIVSRFREELAADQARGVTDTAPALRRTVLTAGRTVAFSAFTVAVALSALLVFPLPYLRSLGSAGILTVLSAAFFALLVLPAVLAVLGRRIDALSFGRGRAASAERVVRRWERLARGVMRRPVVYAIGGVAVLLVIASPMLGIKFTGVDSSVLPLSTSSGQVAQQLSTEFAQQPAAARIVLDGGASASAVADYATRLGQVSGVRAVSAPVALGADHQEIDVALSGQPLQASSLTAVQQLERVAAPTTARFTGATADFLAQRASIGDHLLPAGLLLAALTMLLLFLFTGSVWLAVQGLLMNALSVAASFGMLVFVFQHGHLGSLLDFTATGALEETSPVILFALAFGLSTDYNVFLLGRIKEARGKGQDERGAVAVGLSRTGGIVTSAALLFVVAIGALGISHLTFIKELGIGAAFAVLIDATVVRTLLVPALMALLGKAAWWAPGPLRAFHARFGVNEGGSVEEEPAAEAAPVADPDLATSAV
ncbi:MMPL family transporter [Streptacidiphilus jiangxiensis]|uniref:Putative drug exporter of the RND superfamily n=1 Tax=Streptacidiphilus jiangxiensis TaxID=235985 RepID=A0A1H7IF11_STRJI|nr:MMPL family transporter [Streptacidiphilus jiangxiensis]SEK59225.1 putative drug exporter of the RND superfamily [Streptacidiphilus jiangxiensis]